MSSTLAPSLWPTVKRSVVRRFRRRGLSLALAALALAPLARSSALGWHSVDRVVAEGERVQIEARSVSAQLSGSSHAQVLGADELTRVEMSGASVLAYPSHATIGERRLSGGATLEVR